MIVTTSQVHQQSTQPGSKDGSKDVLSPQRSMSPTSSERYSIHEEIEEKKSSSHKKESIFPSSSFSGSGSEEEESGKELGSKDGLEEEDEDISTPIVESVVSGSDPSTFEVVTRIDPIERVQLQFIDPEANLPQTDTIVSSSGAATVSAGVGHQESSKQTRDATGMEQITSSEARSALMQLRSSFSTEEDDEELIRLRDDKIDTRDNGTRKDRMDMKGHQTKKIKIGDKSSTESSSTIDFTVEEEEDDAMEVFMESKHISGDADVSARTNPRLESPKEDAKGELAEEESIETVIEIQTGERPVVTGPTPLCVLLGLTQSGQVTLRRTLSGELSTVSEVSEEASGQNVEELHVEKECASSQINSSSEPSESKSVSKNRSNSSDKARDDNKEGTLKRQVLRTRKDRDAEKEHRDREADRKSSSSVSESKDTSGSFLIEAGKESDISLSLSTDEEDALKEELLESDRDIEKEHLGTKDDGEKDDKVESISAFPKETVAEATEEKKSEQKRTKEESSFSSSSESRLPTGERRRSMAQEQVSIDFTSSSSASASSSSTSSSLPERKRIKKGEEEGKQTVEEEEKEEADEDESTTSSAGSRSLPSPSTASLKFPSPPPPLPSVGPPSAIPVIDRVKDVQTDFGQATGQVLVSDAGHAISDPYQYKELAEETPPTIGQHGDNLSMSQDTEKDVQEFSLEQQSSVDIEESSLSMSTGQTGRQRSKDGQRQRKVASISDPWTPADETLAPGGTLRTYPISDTRLTLKKMTKRQVTAPQLQYHPPTTTNVTSFRPSSLDVSSMSILLPGTEVTELTVTQETASDDRRPVVPPKPFVRTASLDIESAPSKDLEKSSESAEISHLKLSKDSEMCKMKILERKMSGEQERSRTGIDRRDSEHVRADFERRESAGESSEQKTAKDTSSVTTVSIASTLSSSNSSKTFSSSGTSSSLPPKVIGTNGGHHGRSKDEKNEKELKTEKDDQKELDEEQKELEEEKSIPEIEKGNITRKNEQIPKEEVDVSKEEEEGNEVDFETQKSDSDSDEHARIGICDETYKSFRWLYINKKSELDTWGQLSGTPTNRSPISGAPTSPIITRVPMEQESADSDTESERGFKKSFETITHRMIHRKASLEMFKRLLNNTFETEKEITITKKNGEFGFRIHGSRPVVVSAIECGTPAESCGLQVGDIIVTLNGENVLDSSHSDIVRIAHSGTDTLEMELVGTRSTLGSVIEPLGLQSKCIMSGFLERKRRIVVSSDKSSSSATTAAASSSGNSQSLSRTKSSSKDEPPSSAPSSASVTGWKRRFFSLHSDLNLFWFKDQEDAKPLGVIKLHNCQAALLKIEPKKGVTFKGSSSNLYVFTISGPSGAICGQSSGSVTPTPPSSLATSSSFSSASASGAKIVIQTLAAHTADVALKWVDALNDAIKKFSTKDPYYELSSSLTHSSVKEIKLPETSGVLSKFCPDRKTWKAKFLVLKDACLYFYANECSDTALGCVYLQGYKVQSCSMAEKKNTFELVPPPGAKLPNMILMARNDTDKKRWLTSLEYSIDRWMRMKSFCS